MSFNEISRIENLSKLQQLTDLSLTSNQITLLDGVQDLPRLEVLSLGTNTISGVKQVCRDLRFGLRRPQPQLCVQMASLRKMSTLRVLNLMHNPVAKETDYRLYAIAYCPQLNYVDFEAVEDHERQAIKDSALAVDEIRELDERLMAAQEAAQKEATEAAWLASLEVSAASLHSHAEVHQFGAGSKLHCCRQPFTAICSRK